MKSSIDHRILVVEDSEDDAELILGAFARSRFRAQTFVQFVRWIEGLREFID